MIEDAQTATSRWRTTLVACGVILLGLLGLFWQTGLGMVSIWNNYATYTHGFLILPISLWLIWQKRKHLAAFTPQPSPGLLVLVAVALLLWALGRLTGIQVLEQLGFVAVLVSSLASVLGWQISAFLTFPLLFLFLGVPMGVDLVPPMMEFTATFTVEALKLTGIPVYRDGLWFSLPSGNWSVVEACSGVRYLIASVTLGVMYAFITYHTLWKRLLFIAMSAIVPILANGVRAYMIVMIGHLSKMEYAVGVDHLLYGWIFFGIVMFILFWIGSFWQEEQEPPSTIAASQAMDARSTNVRILLVCVLVFGAAISAIWATDRALSADVNMAGKMNAPAMAGNWKLTGNPAFWSANHQATEHKIEARYTDGEAEVQFFVALFPQQRQGSEAINDRNQIAKKVERLAPLGTTQVESAAGLQFEVNQSKVVMLINGQYQEHLVWQWYRVAGRNLINSYEGKAWEIVSRIHPGRADGAWIAITTSMDGMDRRAAELRLARFASSMAPAIGTSIDKAIGQAD